MESIIHMIEKTSKGDRDLHYFLAIVVHMDTQKADVLKSHKENTNKNHGKGHPTDI